MSTVTRWALKHKKIVVLFWLCLTAAGAFASLSVGNKLTKGLPIPGQPAYEANMKILRTFGIDGHQQPTIAVLHLPTALSMRTAAGKHAAGGIGALAQQRKEREGIVERPAPGLSGGLLPEEKILAHRQARKYLPVLGHVTQAPARDLMRL